MTAEELRKKYIKFFQKRGHREIPNLSLIPEGDSTALFISAGMHPLIPYLLGEPHPLGKRLVNCQRCLRTDDLEEVGDTSHHTFFEMLGNWSLGDFFKKEMIPWSLEFVTQELGLKKKRLLITIFQGDAQAPYDRESEKLWRRLGIPKGRIFPLGKKDNWWGPVGETGPCGPDSEIFYDTGKKKCSPDCRPGCPCGKYFELWNLVFMKYNRKLKIKKIDSFGMEKLKTYEYVPLKQKNVDTGMGVERTTAILQGKDDVYQTELFAPLIKKIEEISGKSYPENKKAMRIIADHLRAAVFALADGVRPANVGRGYVLRRLLRRAVFQGRTMLDVKEGFGDRLAKTVMDNYQDEYPHLKKKKKEIISLLRGEESKFLAAIRRGIPEIEKYLKTHQKDQFTGQDIFDLRQTYGVQRELFYEIAGILPQSQLHQRLQTEYEKAFEEHQKISRAGSKRKFAGGLAEKSPAAIKLHTATHLLHQALRDLFGKQVRQTGSKITSQRLRFDFTYPKKMTKKEIQQIEKTINEQIEADLPVRREMMSLKKAKESGALAFFGKKYPEKVKVYFIGHYSKEVCDGPHVHSTGEIEGVKIIKEESVGAGKRRIYAALKEG